MSEVALKQSLVVAFISKAISQLVFYKKDKKGRFYSAYIQALKTSPHYKKYNLYKKLKPYIEGRKDIILLSQESFIKKESATYFYQKKTLLQLEEKRIEKNMLNIICKGDRSVFENTYGYEPQFY
jgi:hypothetical protein